MKSSKKVSRAPSAWTRLQNWLIVCTRYVFLCYFRISRSVFLLFSCCVIEGSKGAICMSSSSPAFPSRQLNHDFSLKRGPCWVCIHFFPVMTFSLLLDVYEREAFVLPKNISSTPKKNSFSRLCLFGIVVVSEKLKKFCSFFAFFGSSSRASEYACLNSYFWYHTPAIHGSLLSLLRSFKTLPFLSR